MDEPIQSRRPVECSPVGRPALHQELVERLRDMIVEGRLAGGEAIDEWRMCEDFGVSRTPFREAMMVLAAEELVELIPRRGARIAGLLDIAASQEPDGREVLNNIRYGVFVVFRAPNAYTRDCFAQYGLRTDPSGWYASLWRPYHLIGLEASISVLSASLRGEPTGRPREFRADCVATAKRDLAPGEVLDGEGGFLCWGKAIPAARSLAHGALPIGFAHGARVIRPVKRDAVIRFADVAFDRNHDVLALRREMERAAAG